MWKRALKPLNGGMRSHPRGLISYLPIKFLYLILRLSSVFRWCTIYSEQTQAGCCYLLFSSLFSSRTHRVSVNNLTMLFKKQLNLFLMICGWWFFMSTYFVWNHKTIWRSMHTSFSGYPLIVKKKNSLKRTTRNRKDKKILHFHINYFHKMIECSFLRTF